MTLSEQRIVIQSAIFRTTIKEDRLYYTMDVHKGGTREAEKAYATYFVDPTQFTRHDFLSGHSQAAEAVRPAFEFPFYGHNVDTFYVTTHGFLSLAPRLHNLMYKTQYIAPLRVKLDPSASEDSSIDYEGRDDRFTVQWTNVTVMEPFRHPRGGRFTFQASLFDSGDIAFVYVEVPELLTVDALYDREPVAGLSDAFLLGDSELHVYHAVNVGNPDIVTGTVVVFRAKETCVRQQSCGQCLELRRRSTFRCSWCAKANRCSDGADRLRQHWEDEGCGANNASESCNADHHMEWRTGVDVKDFGGPSSGVNVGGIISGVVSSVLILILVCLALGFVFVYGRSHPGGVAEAIALRLERNYKRFNNDNTNDNNNDDNNNVDEELGPKVLNNNQDSRNMTVSF